MLTVLRLPPGLFAVRLEGGDDVLDAVVDGVVHGVVRPAGVAVEAFLLILQRQMRDGEKPKAKKQKNKTHTPA